MDIVEAKLIAFECVNEKYSVEGDELIVLDEYTIEKSYGWVFFYQSKRYLETQSISHRVGGNGPILVTKLGEVYQFGTLHSVETYLEQYEEEHVKAQPD
jgi:hypothetical protein